MFSKLKSLFNLLLKYSVTAERYDGKKESMTFTRLDSNCLLCFIERYIKCLHFLNIVHYAVTQSLSEAVHDCRMMFQMHQLHASHSGYSKRITIAPHCTYFEEYYTYIILFIISRITREFFVEYI